MNRANKRIRPFSCGSQYGDWNSSNCDQCKKGAKEPDNEIKCELQNALVYAYFDDGTISKKIAKRIGYFKNHGKYIWECPERE